MADSTTPIDQIVVGQAQPAVIANELFDAMSPAAIFGRRAQSTSGLTWGYYGGRYGGAAIDNGTIVLPASQATVYIVANRGTGVVSQSTTSTNWDDVDDYQRLYLAVTGSATITDYFDHREWVNSAVAAVTSVETIQDIVGDLIVAGTGVTVTYDDASSPATLTIDAAGGGMTTEQVQDIVGALLVAGPSATVVYDDASSPASITIDSTGGGGLNLEQVQDAVGSLVVAGTGITVTYDDASSPASLTIEATGAVVDTEQVQDIIGSLLVAGDGITLTYDDASSPATLTIEAEAGSGSCCYSEGAGVPAESPEPDNGWQHFDTDTGILYHWSSYAGAWVEM